MKPVGDPPPSRPAPPPGNPTVLLDHAVPLLSVPNSHTRGGSYHEMLLQLGHHLEDLGSILLAHTVGKDASPASVITASPSCCSTSCVPHSKEERAKAVPSRADTQSTLRSRTVQTKALQAMQREIQSHLLIVREQEQTTKLWDLLTGVKNLPPPVSPWLFDPAITGNGLKNAQDRSSCTVVRFDATEVLEQGNEIITKEKKTGPGAMNSNSSASRPRVVLAEPQAETRTRKSGGGRPEGLEGFLSRKSMGGKNIQMRSAQKAQVSRKTVDMLRNVAKQTSLPIDNSNSQSQGKRMLIGNGRQARHEQRKNDRVAAMASLESHMRDENVTVAFSLQDSAVAIVILLNALVMGVSADIQWQIGWEILEYLFTAFFMGEMLYKMRDKGIGNYFVGTDWSWNVFDFVVVMIALIDLAIGLVLKITNTGDAVDLSKFTAVKLARLGRLARLIRLLRFKMFKELKAMVTGVFAGLHVLMWAIILFFAFIFGLAMVIRNVYLDEEWEYMRESFGTTPWAMFTLFRCFTDGCSAHDGTPLIVHFYERYGAYFVICYMLVFLFVTIGLFNLIMAIFVDNVMESTRSMKKSNREANHHVLEGSLRKLVMKVTRKRWKHLIKKREAGLERLESSEMSNSGSKDACTVTSTDQNEEQKAVRYPLQQRIWAKIQKICCCKKQEEEEDDTEGDDALPRDELGDVIIDRELFNLLIEDPEMDQMMEQLDIYTSNRWELFDVLDADMSGHLGMEELIVGFMNLRGPTEKSDVIAALLSVRNTQQMIQDFVEDQEEFATEAMSEISAILSGVQILARFMVRGGEEPDVSKEQVSRNSIDREDATVCVDAASTRASTNSTASDEGVVRFSSMEIDGRDGN